MCAPNKRNRRWVENRGARKNKLEGKGGLTLPFYETQLTWNQVYENHLLDTWFQFFFFSIIIICICKHTLSKQMGCSFSGLNALYDSVNGGGDVWINENRFRIVRQLGEGGFAYVYLVKEAPDDSAAAGLAKKLKGSSHLSGQLPSLTYFDFPHSFSYLFSEIDLFRPDLFDLCRFFFSRSVMAFPWPNVRIASPWIFHFRICLTRPFFFNVYRILSLELVLVPSDFYAILLLLRQSWNYFCKMWWMSYFSLWW